MKTHVPPVRLGSYEEIRRCTATGASQGTLQHGGLAIGKVSIRLQGKGDIEGLLVAVDELSSSFKGSIRSRFGLHQVKTMVPPAVKDMLHLFPCEVPGIRVGRRPLHESFVKG